jgi:hypothetical protein
MKRDERKKHLAGKKNIYLIGEGTGETISRIARASLAQFNRENIEVKTFFLVTNESYISRILKHATHDNALIAFSIIQQNLRDYLIKEAEQHGIKAIDVIGNFIIQLSLFLQEKPLQIPGRQYMLDEEYFKRIEAINFSVKHDDGKLPHGLQEADLILLGISRTGKTPLSTYLANQGWKVANVPVHPEMDPPDELFQAPAQRIFGLTISVESLVKLRESRLAHLGLEPHAKYADPVQVSNEIEWCAQFFKHHPRWRIVDVSSRAIEEVAASIIHAYRTGKKPV